MRCFQCDKGRTLKRLAHVRGIVRGEEFTIRCQAMVCDRCGFQVLSDEQSKAYTVASADAYREKHGLLTSKRLCEARKRLGLSQQAFAVHLGVGVASVKRWEAGAIQDPAMDRLIRLRTSRDEARANVLELEQRLGIESATPVV